MPHDTPLRALGFSPNEAAIQQESASTYGCSHCVLIFKTKVYLYEHLHQVHGLGVEAALRDSGLSSLPQSKPKFDSKLKTFKPNFAFNCKNCSFKSGNWSIFCDHKSQCSGSVNNESELTKPTKSPAVSKETNATKATCKSTSKDVKNYSKSPQTITKYFTAASTIKSDHHKGKDAKTLRLEGSSLQSCGVFQVKATSIDMVQASKNDSHLLSDLITDPTSAKPIDPFKEATLNNTSKRISNESTGSISSKKPKLEAHQTLQTQSSHGAGLSFEVSEDDDDNEEDDDDDDDDELVNDCANEEADASQFYLCKQCYYQSASTALIYSHYEENHPYVRYNSSYIEEKSDQSATFRCLECPVEFSSTVLLRNHYAEDHPDAPDIFTLKSADLNLIYKCFACPFTASTVHSLREHNKGTHPSHKIENPLLFSKYSFKQQSVHDMKRKTEEQESLDIVPTERSSTPFQDDKSPSVSPNAQHKVQGEALFYCGKCSFSHKSVVVLHVHHKKSHPEEPITFDQIRQSVSALPVTESAPNSGVEINLSHTSVKEENLPDAKNITKSTSVDQNLQSASLTSDGDNPTSSFSKERMFFCDQCNYFSPNVKSVVAHHNAKHGSNATIEDVLRHSIENESRNDETVTSSVSQIFTSAQDLYYCQLCNYGNPTLKGIINHQNKIHEISRGREHVLEYTNKIRNQIKNSKVHPTNLILPSGLPLPLIKGKSSMFFCHLCNYGHKSLTLIIKHFVKVHKGCRANSHQIMEHSSIIYERLQAMGHIKQTEQNKDVFFENFKKKTKLAKQKKVKHGPEMQGRLKCFNCTYASHHVYLMRKHLITWHKVKMSFSDIVLLCGAGAQFEPGYYCDICPFRCEDVAEVKPHSYQKHCGRSLSIQFKCTQLYLSPDICDPEKRSLSCNDSDNGIPPQTYPEAYSCKLCSFQGTSFSSITSHYQNGHPVSVKEPASSPDVGNNSGKHSLSNTEQDRSDGQGDFDSYQVPLDFDKVNVSKKGAKEYCCTHCPATFAGHGGLIIHMGMKHRDMIKETPQMPSRMQIFKCPSCCYVNNIRSGALSHTKMKHPDRICKSDSFYVDSNNLKNVEMKVKNGNWKFCGYICKECSMIYSSKEKLNEHRKTHKQPPLEQVTSASDGTKPTQGIWCQDCGLYCASVKEHGDHLLVCQKKICVYACALCPNSFLTKVQLGIHYTKKHGEKAFFKHYAPLYNRPSYKAAQQTDSPSVPASTVSQAQTLRMFKCPSCRYVNLRHHGTLTHCQMRHPNVVVRAETLKVVEIDMANMVGYLPSSKHYGGFRCKNCPLIYGELKKLKKHCKFEHNSKAASSTQLPVQAQPQSVDQEMEPESASSSQAKVVPKFRHFFKCSMCSFSTSILKSLGRHYRNRHGKSAYGRFYSPLLNQVNKPKPFVRDEKTTENASLFDKAEDTQVKATSQVRVYKCSICSYGTPYRRYLIAHFKNRHKFDIKIINKQMEKFKNWESTLPVGRFSCKKCHNVFFASKGRLLVHYGTAHSSELKMDFSTVAKSTYRSTGIYRCNHCKQKIFGVKNLFKHLEHHREERMKMQQEMESKTVEVAEESHPLALYPVEDEVEVKVREDETVKSPSVSPAPLVDTKVPGQPSEGKHFCLRCKRTFMSLKGLRSHERSHVAFAALDNVMAADSQKNIEEHIVYRPGTTRPYMCTLCSYRTTVLGLAKSHFLRTHFYNRANKHFEGENHQVRDPASNIVEDLNVDVDEEFENSFLEPPDVQRQLRHYNVVAQTDSASMQSIQFSNPRILPCEMCNFNSHHYANMRRHYLRRHGKKLIRCKDCNFFTCFRENLELHERMGHACVQSEPTHQKNLCCPFCLYQSKNKNNMIDHIVLHREERMVPIEVRRSKLSHYLHGIVFRCNKCTFTSGSADGLDSHMAKHDDNKPYKCRLCYFDCSQLKDLEAHLCDKHKVVRNHQLVGQVSLDQLDKKDRHISQDEDDEYEKVLHEAQSEFALRTTVTNKKRAEHTTEETELNKHIREDEASLDIPKMQNVSVQHSVERLKVLTDEIELDENTSDHPAQAKATTESSAVCMEEELCKIQGDPQKLETMECSKPTEYVEDPKAGSTAIDNDSKSNSGIQKDFTEDTTDIGKNFSIPSGSVEHKNHELQERNASSFPNNEQPNTFEEANPYGEMPILEKYFKEQQCIFAQHFENSDKCTGMREEGAEVCKTDDPETLAPPLLLATDDPPAVCSPIVGTMFPCDLCGRNLSNTSELQRHMMRHGM